MQALTLDPAAATLYGQFIEAAYAMHSAEPNSLTPIPQQNFPTGYQLAAWVLMRDFILTSTDPVFYGFIAHKISEPHQFVLAIRGTAGGIEWWDDLNAAILTPFKHAGTGSVGAGFARIYDTLEVVATPTQGAATAQEALPRSLKPAGGFSQQVADLVKRKTALMAPRGAQPSPASMVVTGHSLGAALATLYVVDNANADRLDTALLYTFASPRVGDETFAAKFNALGLTSWRIVNIPDVVPNLPPEFLGFSHVDVARLYNSTGKVQASISCWHALATYMSLIDPSLPPDQSCRRLGAPTVAALTHVPSAPVSVASSTISTPTGQVSINITVNVNPLSHS